MVFIAVGIMDHKAGDNEEGNNGSHTKVKMIDGNTHILQWLNGRALEQQNKGIAKMGQQHDQG